MVPACSESCRRGGQLPLRLQGPSGGPGSGYASGWRRQRAVGCGASHCCWAVLTTCPLKGTLLCANRFVGCPRVPLVTQVMSVLELHSNGMLSWHSGANRNFDLVKTVVK
jgi:hypothetical protein